MLEKVKPNIESDLTKFDRHQLAWLRPGCSLKNLSSASYHEKIRQWINKGWPCVIARSNPSFPDIVNLGISFPCKKFNSKPLRTSFSVNITDIEKTSPPLLLSEVIPSVSPDISKTLLKFEKKLGCLKENTRVFGSFLLQAITGCQYVKDTSDIDLLISVKNLEECFGVYNLISELKIESGMSVDCELFLSDDSFINLKELFKSSKNILVKRYNSVALADKKNICNLLKRQDSPPDNLNIAAAAGRAVYEEIVCYPKPGLVSFYDSGSHTDMDASVFAESIRVLKEFFGLIIKKVEKNAGFGLLKELGIEAERKMLEVTGGVNTHRGAIFSLGILVAAVSSAFLKSNRINDKTIRAALLSCWKENIIRHKSDPNSHGNIVKSKYGINGICLEAAEGFPAVFDVGLPVLRDCKKKHCDWNTCMVQTFFSLLAELDDTNILYRGGKNGLYFARDTARAFLNKGGVFQPGWYEKAVSIHREFISRNLSPGGCADILACSIFIYIISDNSEKSWD